MPEDSRHTSFGPTAYRKDREHKFLEAMRAMIDLADSLHPDFDMADLLYRLCYSCVDLLSADADGLVATDDQGRLQIVAGSSDRARSMTLLQLRRQEGPSFECFRRGHAVSVTNLATAVNIWPRFAAEADRCQFASVDCLPMRLRTERIGVLTLFRHYPIPIPTIDIRIAQAFADVTTTAILQERAVKRNKPYAEQLEASIQQGIGLDRAKHIVSERVGVGPDEALSRMRTYAYKNNLWLKTVARRVTEGALAVEALATSSRVRARPAGRLLGAIDQGGQPHRVRQTLAPSRHRKVSRRPDSMAQRHGSTQNLRRCEPSKTRRSMRHPRGRGRPQSVGSSDDPR